MEFDRSLRRLGRATTAVGLLLCVAAPARADGNNFITPMTNWVTAPFGNHNKPGDDPDDIDYRPRPTLVVPPSSDLPAPHASSTPLPDWPKASDSAAARRARADSRRPAPVTDSQVDGMPLPPDDAPVEASSGRTQTCTMSYGVPVCISSPFGAIALPGGLLGNNSDNGDVHLSSNPRRHYLTDPPVTYLQPAPIRDDDQGGAGGKTAATGSGSGSSNCLTPGWFGCPANDPVVHISQSSGSTASAPTAPGGQPSQAPAAPPPQMAPKKCLFSFGC